MGRIRSGVGLSRFHHYPNTSGGVTAGNIGFRISYQREWAAILSPGVPMNASTVSPMMALQVKRIVALALIGSLKSG